MSNFAILRIGKIKSAGSVRGMLKHNFRTIDTPNANEELTHQNEHLASESVEEGMKIYRNQLPEKVRKNAVHALDYMITTSKEATEKDKEKAMQEGYNWVVKKHGKENIVMASKHRDETTPHIHILVTPIDSKGKLNAQHFVGGSKYRMSEIQDEFYQHLKDKEINLERGIKGSRAKHQSIKSWHSKNKDQEQKNVHEITKEINTSREREKTGRFSKESQEDADVRTMKTLRDKLVDNNLAHKNTKDQLKTATETNKKNQKHVTMGREINRVVDEKDLKKFTAAIEKETHKRAKNQKLQQQKVRNKSNQDIER